LTQLTIDLQMTRQYFFYRLIRLPGFMIEKGHLNGYGYSPSGSFNNYVDNKRGGGDGVSKKSMLGHLTKGRYHVKYPQLSTRGGGGQGDQNLVRFGPRSC
jgi:hypothetical protein